MNNTNNSHPDFPALLIVAVGCDPEMGHSSDAHIHDNADQPGDARARGMEEAKAVVGRGKIAVYRRLDVYEAEVTVKVTKDGEV